MTLASLALLTGLLAACGAPKSHYPGAADNIAAAAAAESAPARGSGEPAAAMSASETIQKHQRLIEQMQQQGMWFASLAHIDALDLAGGGPSSQSIRLRADALRNTDQTEEAGATYRRLLGTPLEASGLRGLGLLAGARGDFGEATDLLQRAQRRAPTDALLLSDLGYALLRQGRVADARVPLMQASQLSPENAQIHVNLALYLLISQQPEQAQALMDAQRLSPESQAAIRRAAAPLLSSAVATGSVAKATVPVIDTPRQGAPQ